LPAFRAIAAVTAMGSLEFTYFLGRAAPSNLIWVSPPAVTLLFLWLGTAGSVMGPRAPRTLAAGSICLFVALAWMGAKPYLKFKFDGSALGSIIAAQPSLPDAINALTSNAVVSPPSAELVRVLDSRALAHRSVAVIAYPPIQSEALIRAGRASAVGETNPCQSALSTTAAGRALGDVRAFPLSGALVVLTDQSMPLLQLQQYELALMQARFKLRITESQQDLSVYEPVAVKRSWHGGSALAAPPAPGFGEGCA
jgi:hypothetical protein